MYNSLYPINVKTYLNRQGYVKKNDEQNSNEQKKQEQQESQDQNQNNRQSEYKSGTLQYPRQQYSNGQQTTIDYSRSTINVAQIITDFKNTTLAIGAPDNIKSEVSAYLGLIEGESLKPNPNGRIIHTNLKTASQILDNYITETLKKKSDVVEKWIDALFLQKIDFKYNADDINPDFQVQLPKRDKEPVQEAAQPQEETQKSVQSQEESAQTNPSKYPNLPENEEVKKAFLKGRKYGAINDAEKALDAYAQALKLATDHNDEQAKPLIFFEVAKIYDGFDLLPQALTLYNKAATNSIDPNIKTKAYYSMAKIYDAAVQFHPAMEHYYASIAFAGEAENLTSQTFSLMGIAGMFAEKYDTKEAKSYFQIAHEIAEEAKNNKLCARIYKLSANKMGKLNESKTALDYYKLSSKHYNKIKSNIELASNYTKSSDLMLKLGNKSKAIVLLKKAQKIYKQNNRLEDVFNIEKTLQKIAV